MLARWRSIKRRHKFSALSFAFLSKISLFITFFKNYHISQKQFSWRKWNHEAQPELYTKRTNQTICLCNVLVSRQIYKLTALCSEEAGFSSSSWRGRLKKLSWARPDLSRGLQFVSILYGLVCMIFKRPKQWLIKYSETINFLRINPRTFAIGAPKVTAQTSFQFAKLRYIQGYCTTSIFPFNWVQFFFLWGISCDPFITKSCFLLEGHQFVSVRYVRQ